MITLDSSELKCSLCQSELDTKTRQPRLVPKSGQTVCQVCVNSLTVEGPNTQGKPKLEDFPLNHTLIKLLQSEALRKEQSLVMHQILSEQDHQDALTTSFDEQPIVRNLNNDFLDEESDSCKKKKTKSQLKPPNSKRNAFATQTKEEQQSIPQPPRQCHIHKRTIEVVCLDCKEMICTNCALFGNHKGHNIYSEDDILMMVGDRAQEIFEKIESIQKHCKGLEKDDYDIRFKDAVKDVAQKQQNRIRMEFDSLRQTLDEQEHKAINQVLEQVQAKIIQWESWWEQNMATIGNVDQAVDWCLSAKQVIEAISEIKTSRTQYWDLLTWSENIKTKGNIINRELGVLSNKVEQQLQEGSKNLLHISFNSLPVTMALEDFFRVGRNSTTNPGPNLKRIHSPTALRNLVSTSMFPPQSHQEDSDLLSNPEDMGKSVMDCDVRNNQASMMISLNDTYGPLEQLQPSNIHYSSVVSKIKTKQPYLLNSTQQRYHRSTTPHQQEDNSVSPAPPQLKETQRVKKRPNAIQTLPLKMQQYVELLKNGANDQIADFSGHDINSDLASSLGVEAKLWRTKTLKLMRCKLSDDAMQTFFQALQGSNDNIQAVNFAQNNLTDRAIDILRECMGTDLINKNIKNIILSQNKINARKCQPRILELKRLGLTITL